MNHIPFSQQKQLQHLLVDEVFCLHTKKTKEDHKKPNDCRRKIIAAFLWKKKSKRLQGNVAKKCPTNMFDQPPLAMTVFPKSFEESI